MRGTLRRVNRGVDGGRRLKDLRLARGLSQEKLGQRAGMKRTEISAHERGKPMGPLVGPRLAEALGVPVEELVGEPPPAAAISAKDDRRLDDLLAELGEEATGVDALVAEALQLLTRRLRLVERRQARAAP